MLATPKWLGAVAGTTSRSVNDHLLPGVGDEKPSPEAPPTDLYLIGQDQVTCPCLSQSPAKGMRP